MIKILNKNEYAEWDDFVFNHKHGSIYHTSNWVRIIEKSFRAKPVLIVKKDNSISAGIPFFNHNSLITGSKLSSITSAQFCNPLVSNINELTELLNFTQSYAIKNKIKHIEIKTTDDFEYLDNTLGIPESDYCTYTLSLESPYEEIEKSFHKSCIVRPLKKAYKNNLRMIIGSSIEDVKIFYSFYEAMRKENGLIPQPFDFFKNLWDELSPRDSCEIFHAENNGKIISSVFNLMYKQTYIYEYGATDSAYSDLHPSHFLLDNSIKSAISKNYKVFDFGRTENSNTGLMDFKRRWGTSMVKLNYYHLPPNENISAFDNKIVKNFISRIIYYTPTPIYRAAGKFIYQFIF